MLLSCALITTPLSLSFSLSPALTESYRRNYLPIQIGTTTTVTSLLLTVPSIFVSCVDSCSLAHLCEIISFSLNLQVLILYEHLHPERENEGLGMVAYVYNPTYLVGEDKGLWFEVTPHKKVVRLDLKK
jgi:hypothetical protein